MVSRTLLFRNIFITLVVFTVPLVVYAKVIPLDDYLSDFWSSKDFSVDFFAYWKSIWLLIFVSGSLFFHLLGTYYPQKSIDTDYPLSQKSAFLSKLCYSCIVLYAVFVVFSTLFSDFREVSLTGFIERREGMLVLLTYMLLFYVSFQASSSKIYIQIIFASMIISGAIVSSIGIMQFFGFDIFQTNLIQSVIIPAKYEYLTGQIEFILGPYKAYSTVYNSNYLGMYSAMLCPIIFIITLYMNHKNTFYGVALSTIMYLLLSLFFLTIIISSRTALLSGVVSVLLILILLRKSLPLKRLSFFLIIITIGHIIIFFNPSHREVVADSTRSLYSDLLRLIVPKDLPYESEGIDISMGQYSASISPVNAPILRISSKDMVLRFEDQAGQAINYQVGPEKKAFQLLDNRYHDYILTYTPQNILVVSYEEYTIRLGFREDGIYFVDHRGHLEKIHSAPFLGFENNPGFASYRGYIWSRTFPLLTKTYILGFGPDTFALYFPQNDHLGRLNSYPLNDIIDKPHNLYLQKWINTGMISILALFFMFLLYIVTGVCVYYKREHLDEFSAWGAAILAGCLGYLIAGMANDSVVAIAPVFWVLLGMGMRINFWLLENTI